MNASKVEKYFKKVDSSKVTKERIKKHREKKKTTLLENKAKNYDRKVRRQKGPKGNN